jgi:phage terminase small subunit
VAKKKLRPKQKLFVSYYLKTKNATKAAKLAGYSKKTAYSIGQENLTKPDIAAEVSEGVERIAALAELKAADVLKELQKLAFANLALCYNENGTMKLPSEMPPDVQAALNGYETEELIVNGGFKIGNKRKVKMHDKTRALELLGKHFKLFTDILESKVAVSEVPPSQEQLSEAFKKSDIKY